jgi:hypothetical protein
LSFVVQVPVSLQRLHFRWSASAQTDDSLGLAD